MLSHDAVGGSFAWLTIGTLFLGLQAAADTPTVGEPASGEIGEIIVTAERVEQSLQRAPLTIQVVAADQLRASGVTSPADLSKLTTGLDIGTTGSGNQVYIRGVGDFSFSALSNPGVAFNVDGVYVGRPGAFSGNFYDMARVEVLKGPQGTLYGRNANGGSINLITQDPKLGVFGGDMNVEAGNYSLVHVDGAVNLPVGDTAALRAAFNVVHRDGYLSNGTNDDAQQSGRVKFKWEPSSDVTLLLNTDYSHAGGEGGGYVYLLRRPGASPWESVAAPASISFRDSMLPLGPLLDPTGPNPRQNSRFWNVSAQLNWRLPFATLTILPAYRNANIDSTSYPGFTYMEHNQSGQSSLETRLGDSTPNLTWVVGGYFFKENVESTTVVYESPILQDSRFPYDFGTKAYAGFGQATYQVIDGLRLIGGIRYTTEDRTLLGDYFDDRALIGGPGVLLEHFDTQAKFHGVTYKIGAEYDLAPRNMMYATVSTGFKAGGLNETIPPEAVYKPEHLTAVEVGSKNRFLDNRLQVNAGYFHWLYKDLQDSRVTFDPTGTVNLLFVNVGDAIIQGANFEIIAKPTRSDTVTASAEYDASHYQSFTAQIPTAVFSPGSIGCPTHIDGANTVANCAGEQVARVPRSTGLLGYDHSFGLPNDGSIDVSGSMKFAASRWIATDFIPSERVGSYTVFDAHADYVAPNSAYSVSAYVRNIGNKVYYTGGLQQPFIAGLFAANIAPPRTFGAQISYTFGAR
jgi:iron complex outermembrane receptor protein